MRKKCRRLLSLLLAVVMVAAMMPAALAADDSAADTAFKNGPVSYTPLDVYKRQIYYSGILFYENMIQAQFLS